MRQNLLPQLVFNNLLSCCSSARIFLTLTELLDFTSCSNTYFSSMPVIAQEAMNRLKQKAVSGVCCKDHDCTLWKFPNDLSTKTLTMLLLQPVLSPLCGAEKCCA